MQAVVKFKIFDNSMKKIGVIFLIFLIGISLRLYNVDRVSLWFDEAHGISRAQNLEIPIVDKDAAPPLYILFLRYWGRVSDTEFWLRLPSVIIGSISILMAYSIGKLLFTDKAGLFSAFLLSISPLHIYYSQEARMYSFMTLFTLLSVYFLIRLLRDKTISSSIGYIVFNLLSMYTHYISIFIWVSENIFFLVSYRKSEKSLKRLWFTNNLLIFLLFLPWAILLSLAVKRGIGTPSDCYWLPMWPPDVSLKSLFMTIKNLSIGYNATRPVYLAAAGIFLFLFIKGIFKMRKQKNLILSLLCFFVPIATLFIISKIKPFYVDRYFIASSLFYYFIVACGLESMNQKVWPILAVILILSVFSLKNYYNNFLPYSSEEHVGIQRKKAHQAVAKYICERLREGDGIYHTERNTIYPFIFYFNKYRDSSVRIYSGIRLSPSNEKDRLAAEEFDLWGRRIDRSNDIAISSHKRIWLIFSSWDFERIEPEGPEEMTVKYLKAKYKNIEHRDFDGAIVYLYENRAPL